MNKISDLLEIT